MKVCILVIFSPFLVIRKYFSVKYSIFYHFFGVKIDTTNIKKINHETGFNKIKQCSTKIYEYCWMSFMSFSLVYIAGHVIRIIKIKIE